MGKVEKKRDVSAAAGVSLACVSATAGQQTDSSVASACIGANSDHFHSFAKTDSGHKHNGNSE
jgi:hypothetical protein